MTQVLATIVTTKKYTTVIQNGGKEDVKILRIWRMFCMPHMCVIHFGTFVWRPPWNNDVKGPILKSFEALNTRRFNFISVSKFLIHSCQFNFYTVDAHLRYRRTQNKSHLVCTIFVAHQNPFPANYTLLDHAQSVKGLWNTASLRYCIALFPRAAPFQIHFHCPTKGLFTRRDSAPARRVETWLAFTCNLPNRDFSGLPGLHLVSGR